MSSVFVAKCEYCGCSFEYGLFSRNYPFCETCAAELDEYAIKSIGRSKMPGPEDWPDVFTPRVPQSEVDRQVGYTQADHRWWMDR